CTKRPKRCVGRASRATDLFPGEVFRRQQELALMEDLVEAFGEHVQELDPLRLVPTLDELEQAIVNGTAIVGVIVEEERQPKRGQFRDVADLETTDHVGCADRTGGYGSEG